MNLVISWYRPRVGERHTSPIKNGPRAISEPVISNVRVEARTRIDFFPDLPTGEETVLEAQCPGDDWKLDQRLLSRSG